MTLADAGSDALSWVHEDDPRWDADRERVFASVPQGVFRTEARRPGERLSSDWWRVERDGAVIGYGWLDDVWGDAEVLLAVAEDERRSGVGAFVLSHLEREAAARGLNYVVNVVRDTHPERAAVTSWLERRGYSAAREGPLRKRVGGDDVGQRQEGRPGVRSLHSAGDRQARYRVERERAAGRPRRGSEPPVSADRGPGAEESGGYVDPEQHRY